MDSAGYLEVLHWRFIDCGGGSGFDSKFGTLSSMGGPYLSRGMRLICRWRFFNSTLPVTADSEAAQGLDSAAFLESLHRRFISRSVGLEFDSRSGTDNGERGVGTVDDGAKKLF